MIHALRVTLSYNVPYEKATLYSALNGDEFPAGTPQLFEDSQVVLECKDGTFVLPHYQITLVHLARGRQKHCESAPKVKRVRLCDDQVYEDCQIIPQSDWDRLGVPRIFHDFEQFVFTCKEGLFVACDFNVMDVRL